MELSPEPHSLQFMSGISFVFSELVHICDTISTFHHFSLLKYVSKASVSSAAGDQRSKWTTNWRDEAGVPSELVFHGKYKLLFLLIIRKKFLPVNILGKKTTTFH